MVGFGVMGDFFVYCIDMVIWLNGKVVDVIVMMEIFIKEWMYNFIGKKELVIIDDVCVFFCYFENGFFGFFELIRYVCGYKVFYMFEINGEYVLIKWDLYDLYCFDYFDYGDEGWFCGWCFIYVMDYGGEYFYMDVWWVFGL